MIKSLKNGWTNICQRLPHLECFLYLLGIPFYPWFLPGDYYREGRLEYFFFIGLFPVSYFIGKKTNAFFGLAYFLLALRWLSLNAPEYGYTSIIYIPLFVLLADRITNMQRLMHKLLRSIVWSQLILAFMQAAGYNPLEKHLSFIWDNVALGTMGHQTLLGPLLACLVPMALMLWTKWEALLMIAVIIYTGSTMACISLIAGLSVMGWRLGYKKILIVGMGIIGSLASIALFLRPQGFAGFFSFTGRLSVWPRALMFFEINPLGWGPNSWLGNYVNWKINYPGLWDHLHNDWLQILIEGGLFVFLAVFAGLVKSLHKGNAIYAGGLAALMFDSMGNFPAYFCPTALMYCIFIAMCNRNYLSCSNK